MSNVKQSIIFFKERIQVTLIGAFSPIIILSIIFTADPQFTSNRVRNSFFLSIKLLALAAAPAVIAILLITIPVGTIAIIAQAIIFPVQLLISYVKDFFLRISFWFSQYNIKNESSNNDISQDTITKKESSSTDLNQDNITANKASVTSSKKEPSFYPSLFATSDEVSYAQGDQSGPSYHVPKFQG